MENESLTQREDYLQWIVAGMLGLLGLAAYVFWATNKPAATSRVTSTLAHLKDIDTALFLYAGDHNDRLPAADKTGRAFTNSNEAFRALFVEGYLKPDAESVFSVYGGPAKVDEVTGAPPDFTRALEPGECHWAMVKGGSYSQSGPLVWENSASGGWNPVWDPRLEHDRPGGTWSGGRVILLTAGHAVKTYKLADPKAPSRIEDLGGGGKNIFTQAGPHEAVDPVGLR